MKTSIHVRRGCNTEVRTSVQSALEKIPPFWKEYLPDFTFSSVKFNHLPQRAQKVWGIGSANPRGYARGWSVRVVKKPNGHPWNIQIFLLDANEPEGEYLFQKDILSAMFTCVLENKEVMDLAEAATDRPLRSRFRLQTLITRELPSFLMNPQETPPNLRVFFERLSLSLHTQAKAGKQ